MCRTKGCLNDRAPGRRVCNKCRTRAARLKSDLKATYYQLKSNAKRRFIPFYLTLEDWNQFCRDTNYLKLRGITKDSLTVDRIQPDVGYILPNIQALTLSENCKKARLDVLKRKWQTKEEAGTPF